MVPIKFLAGSFFRNDEFECQFRVCACSKDPLRKTQSHESRSVHFKALLNISKMFLWFLSLNTVFIFSRSTSIRGILLTSTSIMGAFGTMVAYAIGPFVSYHGTGYFALAMNIVHIVGILFIPESPVYYAIKGKTLIFNPSAE